LRSSPAASCTPRSRSGSIPQGCGVPGGARWGRRGLRAGGSSGVPPCPWEGASPPAMILAEGSGALRPGCCGNAVWVPGGAGGCESPPHQSHGGAPQPSRSHRGCLNRATARGWGEAGSRGPRCSFWGSAELRGHPEGWLSG